MYIEHKVLFMVLSVLILSFLISYLLQKLLIKISKINKLTDFESDRKLEKTSRPRFGGVGIFIAFFVSIYLFFIYDFWLGKNLLNTYLKDNSQLLFIYVGSLFMVFMLGVLDDLYPLSAKPKIIIEVLIASVFFLIGFKIEILSLPLFEGHIDLGFLSYPITILWIVGIVNAVNLIDGIDGLAGGVVSLSSFAMIVILVFSGEFFYAIILIPFLAAIMGFLPFNKAPSKIYMGDCGSLFAGAVLSTIALKTSSKASFGIIMFVPFSVLALPIIDTSLAFIRRIIKGKSPFSPDADHIHHRLLNKGFSERKVTDILLFFSLVFSILGILAYFLPRNIRFFLLALFFLLTIFLFIYLDYFKLGFVKRIFTLKWRERMNKVFDRIIKVRKLFLIILIIFIIISFKSILFFINYVSAKYYLNEKNLKEAGPYIFKVLENLPDKNIDNKTKLFFLNSTILTDEEKLLQEFKESKITELTRKYNDNFYFQYIFGDLSVKKSWEHLDQLSYYFLSYPAANNWTKKIFNEIEPKFSKKFLYNLLDFLKWQNNLELFNYLSKKYQIDEYNYIRPLKGIIYQISIHKMKDFVSNYFKIGRDKIGENLLNCYDFENTTVFKNNWFFSDKSNKEPFCEGAFLVDNEEIMNNNMIRVFNIYIKNNSQEPSRGGIWYKDKFEISKGYYLFSFDYWLKNGQEKPGLWLGKQKGRSIKFLLSQYEKNTWIKVIYILNNSKGNVDFVKPLIRMFGKGSMWVDNVFFSKIECESLNFKEPYKIFYQYQ